MEPDDRSIRITVVVDRLPRSNNPIRQRHKVSDGRSCPNILEVRPGLGRQTPLAELVQLGIGLRHTRIKLLEFLGVLEFGRDGLVDGPHDGIIPKRKLFRVSVEADHVTGAGRWWDRGGIVSIRSNITRPNFEARVSASLGALEGKLTRYRSRHREGPKRRYRVALECTC